MTKDSIRRSALGAAPRHLRGTPARVRGVAGPHPWRRASHPHGACGRHPRILREDGQSVSEYLTVVGVTAATVIACMVLFIGPVARAYIGLFKRLVLQFTSVP